MSSKSRFRRVAKKNQNTRKPHRIEVWGADRFGNSAESPRAARKRLADLVVRPALAASTFAVAIEREHGDDLAAHRRRRMAKRLGDKLARVGWSKPTAQTPTTAERLKHAEIKRRSQVVMTAREALAQAYSNRPKAPARRPKTR